MIPTPSNSDVVRSDQISHAPIRVSLRVFLAGLATIPLALLITAANLPPDPRGVGTHESLGLEPCVILTQFGIRCPSCGMTTSWSHLMHGSVFDAFRVNVGGAILALASLFGVVWLLASAIRGRWFLIRPSLLRLSTVMMVVSLVTITDWLIRICM